MHANLLQAGSNLAELAQVWYGVHSTKVWRDQNGDTHELQSTTGIDQGDPLAGSMFNVDTAASLRR
eukprot:4254047-Prorocentrum_lima.AAC.1